MDPINTSLAACAAGLVTSVHCLGMCGPLACGVAAGPATEGERVAAGATYHAARLFSYGMIGAVFATIGRKPLEWFFHSPMVLLPWVLAIVFLIFAFGWEKKLPRPRFLLILSTRLRWNVSRLAPVRRALAIGLLTPLLPCGPLYLLFGACLIAGSAAKGAEFALAFGLGTVPLLWLAQSRVSWLGRKLGPARLRTLQRGLALASALLIMWRLHDTLPLFTSPPAETKSELPSCCH